MERRTAPREPIKLRVKFKTVRAMISEYTTSVSKAGCTLKSEKPIEVDSTFLFELTAEGMERKCLTIEGRVIHCTPRKEGGHDIGIQYVAVSTPRRVAMTRFLDQVFAEQLANRTHARVPVNLIAEDGDDGGRYLIRDLSRGGMGIRLAAERTLPSGLALGQGVEVTIVHDGDLPFVIAAEIVRLDVGSEKRQPAIGLRFTDLDDANTRVVDALLYLHRPQLVQLRFLGRTR